MSRVQAKIEIDAPVQRVWETIMDPRRLGDWVTIHKSVRNISDSPASEGASMEQALSVRGITFHVHWTLIAVRAPRHAEWEGGGPAHSTAIIRYELSPADGNRTIFQYTNEFHPPGGRLGSVAGRFVVGATSEREANNSLSRLKKLLETH